MKICLLSTNPSSHFLQKLSRVAEITSNLTVKALDSEVTHLPAAPPQVTLGDNHMYCLKVQRSNGEAPAEINFNDQPSVASFKAQVAMSLGH